MTNLVCPACHRRTVRLMGGGPGEGDIYRCTWRRNHGDACAWYAWPDDAATITALQSINQGDPT